MSKKALVPLGLIAAAGVMGSLANGQGNKLTSGRRGMGRRGVKYDSAANEAWVAFFSADTPTPEGMRLGRKFRDRIEYLVDNKFNLPDDAEYPDLNDLAYLSYASHAGHGVGLWEDRAPWHSSFEKVVMADKQARDLGYRLDEEIYEGTAGVMFSRGNGQRAKHSVDVPHPPVSEVLGEAYTEIKPGTYVLKAPWGKFMVRAVVKKSGVLGWSWAVLVHGKRIGSGNSPTQRVAFARVEDVLRYDTRGRTGRRAKHSKRDFVKQVWERQAPTMTGGPLPPPIPGMEGPFRFRSGKILYWDPKEGKYYDRGSDMYVMSGRR
jgi:hypothetical protein